MKQCLTASVLVLLLTILAACGGASSETPVIRAADGGAVRSPNGDVTLQIPPGALDQDTAVSIEVAEVDDLPEQLRNLNVVGPVYKLQPEGLRFAEPVTISIELESLAPADGADSITIPFVQFFVFDDVNGLEPIGGNAGPEQRTQAIVFDPVSRSLTMEGLVPHFSWLFKTTGGLEAVFEIVPSPIPVGSEFSADFIVRNTRPKDSGFVYKITTVQPIGIPVVSKITSSLHPDESLEAVDGNMFATTLKYRCDAPGSGFYFVSLAYDLSSGAPPGYKETVVKGKTATLDYVDVGGEVFVVLRQGRLVYWFHLEVKVTCGSGATIAPTSIIPPNPTSTPIPSPTPTPHPLQGASEIFLLPTLTPMPNLKPTPLPTGASTGRSFLVGGMFVDVSITRWDKVQGGKRSWGDLVNVLRYTLHFSVKPGPDAPPDWQQVEFQIFEEGDVFPFYWPQITRGSTEVRQRRLSPSEELLERIILPGPGSYSVKGKIGGEEFEINVEAVEPPVTFGALVKPGTWGLTPLYDPSSLDGLVSVEGSWEGKLPEGWEAVHDPGVVRANLSRLELEKVDQFIRPVASGVAQTIYNGTRLDFDLMLPRARYEGKLIFHLAAIRREESPMEVCVDETVTYDVGGLFNYLPNGEVWAANLELTGVLVPPLPLLAAQLPQKVVITATSRVDEIDRLRMYGPTDDPIWDTTTSLGLLLDFQDLQPNPASAVDPDGNCQSTLLSNSTVKTHALLTFPHD